jgi:hypothetical protein
MKIVENARIATNTPRDFQDISASLVRAAFQVALRDSEIVRHLANKKQKVIGVDDFKYGDPTQTVG